MSTLACTTSVGPGATNMVTGAALATINRLPVLLLPSDVFATRAAEPVLQQLEHPGQRDVSANDAFRPVSRFFDRVSRPEQLPDALLGAMRVLTDPAETGAATICLPQDVQTQACDWPDELFAPRTWPVHRAGARPGGDRQGGERVARRCPAADRGGRRRDLLRRRRTACARSPRPPGSRSPRPRRGRARCAMTTRRRRARSARQAARPPTRLAATADVVIGIGTRWSDFSTASRSAFAAPGVRFININVAGVDAAKHAATDVRGRRPGGADAASWRHDRLGGRG